VKPSISMDSMRLNCPVRIVTQGELDGYVCGSAGAVGFIMAALLSVPRELHPTVAERAAFQLTNLRGVPGAVEPDRVPPPHLFTTDAPARGGPGFVT
jgi:phytoene/squalene synthetase